MCISIPTCYFNLYNEIFSGRLHVYHTGIIDIFPGDIRRLTCPDCPTGQVLTNPTAGKFTLPRVPSLPTLFSGTSTQPMCLASETGDISTRRTAGKSTYPTMLTCFCFFPDTFPWLTCLDYETGCLLIKRIVGKMISTHYRLAVGCTVTCCVGNSHTDTNCHFYRGPLHVNTICNFYRGALHRDIACDCYRWALHTDTN